MKRILSIFMVPIFICLMFIQAYGQGNGQEANGQSEDYIVKFADVNLENAIRAAINKPQGDIVIKDLNNIKKLRADNKNIVSLKGIEYLTNLEELFLEKNNIDNVNSLKELKKLRSLNLWKNRIKDIGPLKDLKDLKILDLDSNKIENIEPLKELYSLKALRLGSNKLIDISALENLKELEYLCLWSNKITDISPLGKLENLKTLRLAYNEIKDISPLANLNNIENLNLFYNNIENIYPLSNMVKLKSLYLMKNEIADISPLAKLTDLESLRLDNNDIGNIKGVTNLLNLKLLTLSKNRISDIDALEGMKKLEYLDLRSNNIRDLEGLTNSNNLIKLFLDENNIYNIKDLSNKEKLITLSLSNNNISYIEPLTFLVNLRYLDLSYNNLRNISDLETLTELKKLYLNNNFISDIEPLKENTKLEELDLKNNYIKEIDSIVNLTNLNNLYISNNLIANIDSSKFNKNLRVLELYNNSVNDLAPLKKLESLEIVKTGNYTHSKDTVTVEGKITDIYNDEYKGANTYITMVNLTGNNILSYSDITNEFGEFEIQGIFPGEYKITLTKKGYKPITLYKNIDFNNKKITAKLEEALYEEWVVQETERMLYKYKKGIEISDIEIELQENKLKEIEEFFGIKIDDKINYNICTYPEEIYELAYNMIEHYSIGTYKADTESIYSLFKAFDFHETCHLVEYKFNPDYNVSLGEGLAIYFDTDQLGSIRLLNRPLDDLCRELMIKGQLKDIKTMLREFKDGNDYILNGAFVEFLLQRYTVEQFRDLFKSLQNRPTDEEIDKIFNEIYKKSVIQIQNEWFEYIKGI